MCVDMLEQETFLQNTYSQNFFVWWNLQRFQVLEPYTCEDLYSASELPKGACGFKQATVLIDNGSNESEEMKNFRGVIIAFSILLGLLWIGQVVQIMASTICTPS